MAIESDLFALHVQASSVLCYEPFATSMRPAFFIAYDPFDNCIHLVVSVHQQDSSIVFTWGQQCQVRIIFSV